MSLYDKTTNRAQGKSDGMAGHHPGHLEPTVIALETTGIPEYAANESGLPMWQQPKQGDKCCRCCCDYRRAVIVVAIITMFVNACTLAGSLTAADVARDDIKVDDDELLEIWDDGLRKCAIFAGVGIAFAATAALGAARFNIYLVGANIVWLATYLISTSFILVATEEDIEEIDPDVDAGVTAHIVMNVIITSLMIYPHVGFIREVRNGIMSRETYPREEFSCCCTPSKY